MESTTIRLTIDHRRIAWLKFLLESYEGLAVMRTIDPLSGRVLLLAAPGAEIELAALLKAVKQELGLVEGLSDPLPEHRSVVPY